MTAGRRKLGVSAKGVGRARMLVAAMIGALMLNPPIVEVFASYPTKRLFGWPLGMLYINLVWLFLILLVVAPKLGRALRRFTDRSD